MFRISRVRIHWLQTEQHPSPFSFRRLWKISPWLWRVRVRWVGFGPMNDALLIAPQSAQAIQRLSTSQPAQILATFNLPQVRVRVSWQKSASVNRWIVVLLLFGMFAYAGLVYLNQFGAVSGAEKTKHARAPVQELLLHGEMIRITHPKLDMGQIQDVFDQDTKTLIRGLDANPFVLDFNFPTPRPITGLVMDFGGMDFDLRVLVYGPGNMEPVLYYGEYRNQPPEPHVELGFNAGPEQVSRIHIEIEQYNAPEEPHIHVREVLFQE